MKQFTIGKLAKESGVGVETVRFYERKGLVKRPQAKDGFRKYTDDDALKIRFIKQAQGLGFTLKEIKELIELNTNSGATCSAVKSKADAKIKDVADKIQSLQKMKSSLQRLAKACDVGKKALACCKVMDCFESDFKC
jgi:DNA-binding transcriptional MerR regulator